MSWAHDERPFPANLPSAGVARLKQHGITDADRRVVEGNATELPWPDHFFDHAISHGTLDSMSFIDARRAATEVARVLRTDGFFYCDLISGDESGRSADFDGEVNVEKEQELGTIQSYFNQAKVRQLLEPHLRIVDCALIRRTDVLTGCFKGRWHCRRSARSTRPGNHAVSRRIHHEPPTRSTPGAPHDASVPLNRSSSSRC